MRQEATQQANRSNAPGTRQLFHVLNQRYRAEFDRAERLQAELADIHGSKAWRFLAWLRSVRRRLSRAKSRPAPGHASLGEPLRVQRHRPEGRVSIVIPFRDHAQLLTACLRSLWRSSYRRFEVILVDNGSQEPATLRLMARLAERRRVSVLHDPKPFNFARLCNAGAARARGDFLLFLNNDTEALSPDWLEEMLIVAGQPDVGIVGATLVYPDLSIQHAGLAEVGGQWAHIVRGTSLASPRCPPELRHTRCVPAVTGACLLIARKLFCDLGGFDERYPLTHNDVDLCERVRRRGLHVAITPYAQLLHYESLSRGYQREPRP